MEQYLASPDTDYRNFSTIHAFTSLRISPAEFDEIVRQVARGIMEERIMKTTDSVGRAALAEAMAEHKAALAIRE